MCVFGWSVLTETLFRGRLPRECGLCLECLCVSFFCECVFVRACVVCFREVVVVFFFVISLFVFVFFSVYER